jgi:uncharacterized protein (DUF58 family)
MSASPPRPEQRLQRLTWTSLRRLDGLLQGDYRTLMRGSGLDLADLRDYQWGDDVRRIDWNATARLDQTLVRDDHEERELTAWFVVDLSPSIDFGSGSVSKRDLALACCALLARLLLRHGNRFGAVFGDGHAHAVLPPGGSRRHLLLLLQRLGGQVSGPAAPPMAAASSTAAAPPMAAAASPAAASSPVAGAAAAQPPPDGAATDLSSLLRAAAGVARRRALVIVVSDFISAPGWGDALARLAMRHDVVGLRVIDPFERELPDIGLVPMRDAETGERLMVDTSDPRLRARHRALAEAAQGQVAEGFAAAGVDGLEVGCDEDPVDAIVDFVRVRRLQARLRAGGASAIVAANTAGGARAISLA